MRETAVSAREGGRRESSERESEREGERERVGERLVGREGHKYTTVGRGMQSEKGTGAVMPVVQGQIQG